MFIQQEGYRLLLDCGAGSLSKFPLYCPRHELDGIIITHYHADHYSDLGCFHHAALVETSLGMRTKKLAVYGPEDPENPVALSYRDVAEGRHIGDDSRLELGPLEIAFSRNVHDCPSYSVKVKTDNSCIVYTGDTGWYDGLAGFCENADLVICESSLYNQFYGKMNGHLTAGEAGRLAAVSGAGVFVLTHLPHYGNHLDLLGEAKEAAELVRPGSAQAIHLAYEGFLWEGP